MIKWRPATEDDIGMLCRFFDVEPGRPIKQHLVYGILRDIGPHQFAADGQFICDIGDNDTEAFVFAEVAEHERTPIAEPQLDIRIAVADALNFWLKDSRHIHGSITNTVVDRLPDWIRQKLYTDTPKRSSQ